MARGFLVDKVAVPPHSSVIIAGNEKKYGLDGSSAGGGGVGEGGPEVVRAGVGEVEVGGDKESRVGVSTEGSISSAKKY